MITVRSEYHLWADTANNISDLASARIFVQVTKLDHQVDLYITRKSIISPMHFHIQYGQRRRS